MSDKHACYEGAHLQETQLENKSGVRKDYTLKRQPRPWDKVMSVHRSAKTRKPSTTLMKEKYRVVPVEKRVEVSRKSDGTANTTTWTANQLVLARSYPQRSSYKSLSNHLARDINSDKVRQNLQSSDHTPGTRIQLPKSKLDLLA